MVDSEWVKFVNHMALEACHMTAYIVGVIYRKVSPFGNYNVNIGISSLQEA